MTATEMLRRLLDERGVKHIDDNLSTSWLSGGWLWSAYENVADDTLMLSPFFPEQAVEATLGRGTCKSVCNSVSEFTCSECGFNCDLTSWISLFDGDDGRHRHHHHGMPNYCPNCGRKVVDE
ncbi:MAG: hypothetical protein IKF14_02220 [Atopobiaceae bacterium]|nr:hypothetical protein [Atopobiaceae bacterium]